MERDGVAQEALDLLENTDVSFFLTGKAWTGKTTLIKHFIETTKKNVLVLAPTGIAALNVNGQTIHSTFKFWAKITPSTVKDLYGENLKLIIEADTIIIDEVSMVRADLMDCIDMSLRRNTMYPNKRFGGKQIILVGDMYQLPPVFEFWEDTDVTRSFNNYYDTKYFFSAMTFKHNGGFKWPVIELTKIYRQEDWPFKDILNAIRDGQCDKKMLDRLNERVGIDLWDNAIHLTTLNRMARKINEDKLKAINERSSMIDAYYIWDGKKLKDLTQMEETLIVKPGAQIIMLNNTPNRRNGTIAKFIKQFDEDVCIVEIDWEQYTVPKYEQEITAPFVELGTKEIKYRHIGTIIQFPFKLARAISIHKAQGSTFDKIYVDLGDWAFDAWQTYVVLSRVKTFEWLSLTRPITMRDVILDEDIKEFMSANQKLSHLS